MNIIVVYFVRFLSVFTLLLFFSLGQSQSVSPNPKVSVPRGFYSESFTVIASAETIAVIKYTLDGSDPRTSSTSIQQNSPVSILINPDMLTGGRGKAPGVVLRVSTLVSGLKISEPITYTYLFVNKAASLSTKGAKPASNWPTPGAVSQSIIYGMNSTVLNDARYKNMIDIALLSIPSISIATDLKNLFAADSGIYVNALMDGAAWERPASIELLNPDGSEGFQINAGLRIRGGYSRHPENPKHAFRLFFREEYGKAKLKYKMFGDEGVDEFDKMDIRTSQNYAWSYPGHMGEYNIMIRDVFSRDLQREMGQPYTRSRFYHLYINGVYWGLFQSQERTEARYAVSYFGGNVEDYDVIKNDEGSVSATDGNMNAYTEVWNMSKTGFSTNANYFKLFGRNADGTKNSAIKVLVDIDNFIDYMLVIFYTGNFDSPVSKFVGNSMPNNFYCIYNRNANEGFKFFAHDAEHTLRTTAGEGPGTGLQENRVSVTMSVNSVSQFQPQYLHNRLTSNTEYKLQFADHVYKHFFNQGSMTPAKATAQFLSRASEIDTAIIAESARWGDTYSNPPRNKDDNWQWAVNDVVKNYFPFRTGIVLSQLQSVGLYPTINPPVFKNNSDTVKTNIVKIGTGYILKLLNSNGTTGSIVYTLDGTDPRLIGGNISATSIDGGDATEITLKATTIVKARILNGTTWSALHEIILFTNDNIKNLKVTEIHYHPLDNDTISGNEYEFLEIKNIGSAMVNLSLSNFTNGISYTFPSGTILNAGGFIVLASNKQEFNRRYKFLPFGEYSGQLDNGGENITLVTATNDTIFSVRYNDKAPWPVEPDTTGYSLVSKEINPTGDPNDASYWRSSYAVHGSPGFDDIPTSVDEPSTSAPMDFELYQNYPNPFNPITTLTYSLKSKGNARLSVYDMLGREVAVIFDGIQENGYHSINFSGSILSSGIYFYSLRSADGIFVRKMMLLK
jgi:hypothetical protein